jgi:ubiquinone/menaquinone biosynthesis C-methylase UbiE
MVEVRPVSGTELPEAVAAFYDETAVMELLFGENIHFGCWTDKSADAVNGLTDFTDAQDHLTDMVGARCGARAGARLLDVGCGTGTPARRLAGTTEVSVTGVTISPTQVEVATTRSRQHGLNEHTSFQLADVRSLPFADDEFDGAMAIESMVHIPDKLQAMREIFRVLRPGAALVIADFVLNEPDAIGQAAADPETGDLDDGGPVMDLMEWGSMDGYQKVAEEAGFAVEEVLDLGEQTQATYGVLLDRLSGQRPEFNAIASTEHVASLEQTTRLCQATVMAGQFGYLLLTARKPLT